MKMFSEMGATVKVKLIDVARHARVSPTTVSRAIAQPDLVNPDTLARVRASAAKLGYVPDGAARALASGRSMTMGAVIPTLDSAIFARALQAMQTALSRQGYQLLVASHDYSAAAEAEAVRMLMTRGVDGLMLVGAQRPAATWDLLESANVAIVLTWCDEPRFSAISVDNARAGRIAAQHLIALGHRRIGVVLGALHFNDRQQARLAGNPSRNRRRRAEPARLVCLGTAVVAGWWSYRLRPDARPRPAAHRHHRRHRYPCDRLRRGNPRAGAGSSRRSFSRRHR